VNLSIHTAPDVRLLHGIAASGKQSWICVPKRGGAPTMKFVATKAADQFDLQALHRVRGGAAAISGQK
jgi:hypothetical protein